jgi:hypothetical protein
LETEDSEEEGYVMAQDLRTRFSKTTIELFRAAVNKIIASIRKE